MGDVQVPAQAYYGAQTQRAIENFPISGWPLPGELVRALGLVKYAAAVANRDLGKLTASGKNRLTAPQVEARCRDVTFPVDSDDLWGVVCHSPLGFSAFPLGVLRL